MMLLTAFQRVLNELAEPFTETQNKLADVNKDGKVDINDATYLQRVLAEIYPQLN